MICRRCQRGDCVGCLTSSCTCGHADSPVRPLTDAERQQVRKGTLTAHVLPGEGDDEA